MPWKIPTVAFGLISQWFDPCAPAAAAAGSTVCLLLPRFSTRITAGGPFVSPGANVLPSLVDCCCRARTGRVPLSWGVMWPICWAAPHGPVSFWQQGSRQCRKSRQRQVDRQAAHDLQNSSSLSRQFPIPHSPPVACHRPARSSPCPGHPACPTPSCVFPSLTIRALPSPQAAAPA